MSTEPSAHIETSKSSTAFSIRKAFNKVSPPSSTQPSLFIKGQQTLNKTTGVANFALNIATGNYTGAIVSAGQQIALTKGTWEAAAEMTKSVAPVAKGLGQFAKKIPLIGAGVTVGFVVAEAGGDVIHGHYGKAAAAATAGVAETGGNLVGFGVGDGAREIVRTGIVDVAGEKYAPDKSGIRQLVEKGIDVGEKYLDSSGPTTTASSMAPSAKKPGKPTLG